MKNYRILQIHNFYQIPGGEDVVVRNEKRLLEEHGHKVYTYYRSNSELAKKGIVGKLFLPFLDEDPKTAEIMTKIVLFAGDTKIKDPYILNQLQE